MKKFTKVCLIVAAVFFLFGIAACAAGAVLGAGYGTIRDLWDSGELEYWGWRIGSDGIGWIDGSEKDWGKDAEESTGISGEVTTNRFKSAEVQQIRIELKHASLNLEELDEEDVQDEIVVEVEENAGDFQVKLENGVLTLKDEHSRARRDYHIKMRLPKEMQLEKLDVENRAGIVESDGSVLRADRIRLEVDAGELLLEDVQTKEFYLEVGAGNAGIDELDAEDAKVHCGVGNIDLKMSGREGDYNYQIKCGVGSVCVNKNSYTALGKEQKIDNQVPKEVTLDCGVGNITLETEDD